MIVEVTDLTKQFRRGKRDTFTAVDRVSFAIAPGERVAFIGPNGAGKSTAAFVGYVPVQILRSFSYGEAAAVVAAALVFPALASMLFRLGLRRYSSGNRLLEVR